MQTGYIQKLKKDLFISAISVVMATVALASTTYAWYVANNTVDATTSTISAQANGMVLQIVAGTEADHGKDNETIAFDRTNGHEISPASTDDGKTWYVPKNWTTGAKVSNYQKVTFTDSDKGEYKVGSQSYYAYVASTYTVYTVRETGKADVYLDGSLDDGAIQVTSNGKKIDDTVAKSMRIGIAIVDRTTKEENLKVVYAPAQPTGTGNDISSIDQSLSGWIAVKDENSTKIPAYPYINEKNYVDATAEKGNWAASKSGDSYIAPQQNPSALAEKVDYNGTIIKVYIWLEGTDADCVNTTQEEINELNSYDVTLSLVGVAVN